jgi:hypothetical protein
MPQQTLEPISSQRLVVQTQQGHHLIFDPCQAICDDVRDA